MLCVSLVLAVPALAAAQTLQGRVLDELDESPIPTALVRLVDESGSQSAITAADSSGFFRITAPEPGVYRVVAERLGYEPFETPLLETRDVDGTYPLDLLMRPAPIPIRGLEISTDQADREIRLMIGMHPNSLRVAPIRYETIRDHAERAHDLSGLIRWGNMHVVVIQTTDGPCYQVRGRGCLPVYLNGAFMNRKMIPVIPLDMLDTIVVLMPKESIAYPGGAVLLYTAAWLR